jgi:hypothetical protein
MNEQCSATKIQIDCFYDTFSSPLLPSPLHSFLNKQGNKNYVDCEIGESVVDLAEKNQIIEWEIYSVSTASDEWMEKLNCRTSEKSNFHCVCVE